MTPDELELYRQLVKERARGQVESWRNDYEPLGITELAKQVLKNESERISKKREKQGKG